MKSFMHFLCCSHLALLLVLLLSGCQPSDPKICKQIGPAAEQRLKAVSRQDKGKEVVDKHKLAKTMSSEESCVNYLHAIKKRHPEQWNEISLCYARASHWSDITTCDKVVRTLDISDTCYHLRDIKTSDKGGSVESSDKSSGAFLSHCIERQRTLRKAMGTAYEEYTSCVTSSETFADASSCRNTHLPSSETPSESGEDSTK